MPCNICGSPISQGCTCAKSWTYPVLDETFARQLIGGPTGWACPTCGKGNAPGTKTCGPCARVTITKELLDAIGPNVTGLGKLTFGDNWGG